MCYNFQSSWRFTTYKEALVSESLKYLGFPSVRHRSCKDGVCTDGLNPQEGFDCSGFITFLLRQIGFPLESNFRHCNDYMDRFGIPIHWEGRRQGDLVIFSRNGLRPTHMGIVVEIGKYIHAPGLDNTTVRIDDLKIASIVHKYHNQLYFFNPIGVKRLAVSSGKWQRLI